MANAASNVISGKPLATGGILVAPKGTALPTTFGAAPNAAFKSVGYVAEDGVEKSEDRSFSEIKDWAGLTVKKSQNGFTVEFSFGFLEYLNAEAAKAIYGDSAVTVTAGTVSTGTLLNVAVDGTEPPHKAWIFEMADGLAKTRIVIPDGQVTATDSTTYNAEDAAIRNVTLTAYPDASGKYYYEYNTDGVFIP